ncbi:hypothetical protein E2C01_017239 [Portunus trituberculatus]|uniref:Uncharacterized protein n=1 Tax=Portunus trituberculatus TaxID=210409 RepID=A0A5B7DT22_PORTR|nr:hypothetical protein [Portunus trituberculatus]
MVVAHSRPPNHTGDHSHPNATIGTRQRTASLRVVTQQGGRTQKRENAAKSAKLSPGTTNSLLHAVTAKPPANQLPQKKGTTPRPRLLSTQNSLATRLNTVPGPKSAHVYLC